MATHYSILAWRMLWTEKPGGLQSTGLQRVGHDRATFTHSLIYKAVRNPDFLISDFYFTKATILNSLRILCWVHKRIMPLISLFFDFLIVLAISLVSSGSILYPFPCTVCVHANLLQFCLTLCNLWTVAHQAPLSMGFSRKKYWSGLPWPPPGTLPDPGIEPTSLMSPVLADGFFTTSTTFFTTRAGKPLLTVYLYLFSGFIEI